MTIEIAKNRRLTREKRNLPSCKNMQTNSSYGWRATKMRIKFCHKLLLIVLDGASILTCPDVTCITRKNEWIFCTHFWTPKAPCSFKVVGLRVLISIIFGFAVTFLHHTNSPLSLCQLAHIRHGLHHHCRIWLLSAQTSRLLPLQCGTQ
jgi:hypothetical protein